MGGILVWKGSTVSMEEIKGDNAGGHGKMARTEELRREEEKKRFYGVLLRELNAW